MERIIRLLDNTDFSASTHASFSFETVANAFKQGRVRLPLLRSIGGGGNCASIALIKAAIGTYGFAGTFKSVLVDHQNKRFLIDLRDAEDRVHHLSFKNYRRAARKSAFVLHDQTETAKDILAFAEFCFAVMVEIKRQTYRWNRRYKRAITDLNKGEATAYIFELLGFSIKSIKDVSIENLRTLEHLVLWNPPHAVYSSRGYYDEFFNGHQSIEPLSELKNIHGGGTPKDDPVGAYVLL